MKYVHFHVHSSVGIVTGLQAEWLKKWHSIPCSRKDSFFFLNHPHRLCGPTSLLAKWYWKLFPLLNSGHCMKIGTNLSLTLMLRTCETIHLFTHVLMACSSFKYRNNYKFTFLHRQTDGTILPLLHANKPQPLQMMQKSHIIELKFSHLISSKLSMLDISFPKHYLYRFLSLFFMTSLSFT